MSSFVPKTKSAYDQRAWNKLKPHERNQVLALDWAKGAMVAAQDYRSITEDYKYNMCFKPEKEVADKKLIIGSVKTVQNMIESYGATDVLNLAMVKQVLSYAEQYTQPRPA